MVDLASGFHIFSRPDGILIGITHEETTIYMQELSLNGKIASIVVQGQTIVNGFMILQEQGSDKRAQEVFNA